MKAYKKLNQHIALLRKTNLHLQTANSLNFSLKEYLQAIDKTDIVVWNTICDLINYLSFYFFHYDLHAEKPIDTRTGYSETH